MRGERKKAVLFHHQVTLIYLESSKLSDLSMRFGSAGRPNCPTSRVQTGFQEQGKTQSHGA